MSSIRAQWAAPGSTSSAACPAVSAAFLQTKNTTGFVSYAGSQVQAIRRRRADFSFNAETSGLVLCYLFAGETAFAIFPYVLAFNIWPYCSSPLAHPLGDHTAAAHTA